MQSSSDESDKEAVEIKGTSALGEKRNRSRSPDARDEYKSASKYNRLDDFGLSGKLDKDELPSRVDKKHKKKKTEKKQKKEKKKHSKKRYKKHT